MKARASVKRSGTRRASRCSALAPGFHIPRLLPLVAEVVGKALLLVVDDAYCGIWSDGCSRIIRIEGSRLAVVDNGAGYLVEDLNPEPVDSIASRQISIDDRHDEVVA